MWHHCALPELVYQPAIGSIQSEPSLELQLRPVINQALVSELDCAVLGHEQASIDQAADDTIGRLRQRSTRDDTPEHAFTFNGRSSTRMR